MSHPPLVAILALVLVAGLGYRVPLTGGALLFDDHLLLEQDARLMDPAQRDDLWTSPLYSAVHLDDPTGKPPRAAGYYRPLALWTMAIPAMEATEKAPWLHLQNVLLQLLMALALLAWGGGARDWRAGLVGALVFLTHPIGAEAVSWITGRSDLLCLALAMGAAALAATHPDEAAGDLGVGLLLLGACLSKEMGLLLAPLVVLAGGARGVRGRAVACGLALGVYAALRHHALAGIPAPVLAAVGSDPASLGATLLAFLGHLMWPAQLQLFLYPPAEAHPTLGPMGLAALVALGLLGLAALQRATRGDRSPLLVLGLVVLPLLPALGLVRMPFPLSNRYLLASTAGYGALASLGLVRLGSGGTRQVVTGMLLLLAGLQLGTLVRGNRPWRSERALLEAMTRQRHAPPITHRHLVQHLLEVATPGESLAAAHRGLGTAPEDGPLTVLRGRAELAGGQLEAARATFAGVPDSSESARLARLNQAHALVLLGRPEDAELLLDHLVLRAPRLSQARAMRGEIRLEGGDLAGARIDLEAALLARPRDPVVRFNLAVTHQRLDDPEAARLELVLLTERYPGEARYAGGLAQALASLGRVDEAGAWLERALVLEAASLEAAPLEAAPLEAAPLEAATSR